MSFHFSDPRFTVCAEKVPPAQEYQQCLRDMCMCGRYNADSEGCECQAFAKYARECAAKSIILDWRDDTLCRKGPSHCLKIDYLC